MSEPTLSSVARSSKQERKRRAEGRSEEADLGQEGQAFATFESAVVEMPGLGRVRPGSVSPVFSGIPLAPVDKARIGDNDKR